MRKFIQSSLAVGALLLFSNMDAQIVENRNFEYSDPQTFATDAEYHAWFRSQRQQQVQQAREATRDHIEKYGDQWGYDNTSTESAADFKARHRAQRSQEVEEALRQQPEDWKQD
ncbi:MAG: hypothetical protein Q4F57_05915 [Weeksellaceae bacterium]|nr:hypothetical protein [Weeksellaceae bacterium]